MKKLLKILFSLIVILLLILATGVAYLNFVYLPWKIQAEGPAFLEQKTKGFVQASNIRYIPFKGVKLKNTAILNKQKKTVFTIEKIYLSIDILTFLSKKEINYRIDLHLPLLTEPITFSGTYRLKEQNLAMDIKTELDIFAEKQTLCGKLNILRDETSSDIELNISCANLQLESILHIKDKDINIERFSGELITSKFELIGDIQNLSEPVLNIYGNILINTEDLKQINPRYTGKLTSLNLQGKFPIDIYLSGKASAPEIGIKTHASDIRIKTINLNSIDLSAKIEDNKEVELTRLYARACEGEITAEGNCRIDKENTPATLSVNISNIDINKMVKDYSRKDFPVHGRLFVLGKISGPLKKPEQSTGNIWINVSGTNILQMPFLGGISEVLKLPELKEISFKEAGGNFTIGNGSFTTEDFKILSDNIAIYFKGYIDFKGDLAFNILPSFSHGFLSSAPNIINILGLFLDSAGNFLGEIKMKGNINNPRYTFKPVAIERILPQVLEQFFNFKKKSE